MKDQVVEAPRLKRRHLLAGGLGAAAAALFGRTKKASAVVDPGLIFKLGDRNLVPTTTKFEFDGTRGTALEAKAPTGGVGIAAFSNIADPPEFDVDTGIWAYGNHAHGGWVQSVGKAGLVAISDKIGIKSVAGNYADLPERELVAAEWLYSKDGFGEWVESKNGIASLAISDGSFASVNVSGAYGDLPENPGIRSAVWNYAADYYAAWSQSKNGTASLSVSENAVGAVNINGAYGDVVQGGGAIAPIKAGSWNYSRENTGSWNQSLSGIGSLSQSNFVGAVAVGGGTYDDVRADVANEPSGFHAFGLNGLPAGCFRSDTMALMAETGAEGTAGHFMAEEGGTALLLMGTIKSDMVGNAMVPRKQDSFFMECKEVTDKSHIQITLNSDIGNNSYWVERMPGKGFMLNFSKKLDGDTAFSFGVVEPA